jgi:hypothetical protein
MAFAPVGKVVGALGVVAGVILAVASCDDPNDDYYRHRDCDYVETHCSNVCDYYCDYYSCYPTCWNQCWDECGRSPRYPGASSSSGTVPSRDASAPSDASAPPPESDAGSGTGVLCTSCVSNSDCETGALCILRGGPPRDAGADSGPPGRGFCGAACTTSQDCPDGFLCSQLGSSRQCLPTGNACD